MNIDKIKESLLTKFNNPTTIGQNRHIVFWYDEDKAFSDIVDQLDLPNVKVHKVNNNYFVTKLLLEKEDLTSNFLLYLDHRRPDNQENWLLDIELYSSTFSADKASIFMNELGLEHPALKDVVLKHIKFFNSAKRLNDCKKFVRSGMTDNDLILAILSTITGSHNRKDKVIMKVILAGIEDNEYLDVFEKYDLLEKFWDIVEHEFGYISDTPNINELIVRLFATHLNHLLSDQKLPDDIFKLLLPKSKADNAFVFIQGWKQDRESYKQYEEYSEIVSVNLNLQNKLKSGKFALTSLKDVDTFEDFDKYILLELSNKFSSGEITKDSIELINSRKQTYWYRASSKIENMYKALEFALNIIEFRNSHNDDFKVDSSQKIVEKYATDYYKLDQFYRKFYYHFDQVHNDILNSIKDKVEVIYSNWYLTNLASVWNNNIEGLIKDNNWWIAGLNRQVDFYNEFVKDKVENKEKGKVFVIISDALRYEVAQEFLAKLKNEPDGSSVGNELGLRFMQGVIPSYTGLGMASLLPHDSLEITEKAEVIIDGVSTQGLANRNKVLKKAEPSSVAIKWNEFKNLSREEKRKQTQEKVIYIYHNEIDAIGDKAETEKEVFKAVERTFSDLQTIIKEITNTLNGTNILITADHGFVYTRESLDATQKVANEIDDRVGGNRRYALVNTNNIKKLDGNFVVPLNKVLTSESKLSVITPKGYMRIKKQGGGSNFVHGGTSLQEIVIPVLEYKHVRRSSVTSKNKAKKVDVDINNLHKTITTNIFPVSLYQKDAVGDRITSRTLKVALWEEAKGEMSKVSNEEIVIFDSTSDDISHRTKNIKLTLRNAKYDKRKLYKLRLMDISTNTDFGIEYKTYDFNINIVIGNDFGDF